MTDQSIPDAVWRPMLASAIRSGAKSFAALHCDDLAAWIAGFDFAAAVWPAEDEPRGFLCLPVMGFDRWRKAEPGLRATAIPVQSQQEAMALLKRFGDPKWLDKPEAPPKSKPNLKLVHTVNSR
jgi:hypothetical protein